MRRLLIANALYALVLPVIEIFVAAYVMRNSHQAAKVLLYQLSIYFATPVAFLLNGYLLRAVAVNYLYAAGMFLSGGALLVLMTTDVSTDMGIALSGGAMGLATGIFWANRGFLALATTNDANRNYFYGVETSIMTITSVLVPLGVGALIASSGMSGGGVRLGYRAVAICALVLSAVSSIAIMRGSIQNPVMDRFVYLRFHPAWYRLLALTALRGLGQGYILTAPALLVLRLVGEESALGRVEAIGSCIAAVCLYFIGRATRQKHRVLVLGAALGLFFAGSAFNAMLFNAAGVLVFMGCLLLAKPMIDLSYYPIQLHVTDVVSHLEGRSQYAYLLNHELGLFAGRFVGCMLFIGIAVYGSEMAALRYALPIVALLQLPSILVARRLAALV